MPEMKVPTKRLNSDDCIVHVGRIIKDKMVVYEGDEYRVHEGEWIELIPVGSIAQYLAHSSMISIASFEKGSMDKVSGFYTQMTEAIAERIVDWNWTDFDKTPLPCPYKNPEVIRKLTADEIIYLLNAISLGETEGMRKNGSGLSRSISSTTGQQPEKQ